MNEKYIQTLIIRKMLANKHKVVITNTTQQLFGEQDVLSVNRNGLTNEFEIKCTLADYNRDFKRKQSKHWFLKKTYNYDRLPAYYWFVTYLFDIDPPEYAGWMRVIPIEDDDDRWYPKGVKHKLFIEKRAPMLHDRKWDDAKLAKLARLLSYRLLNIMEAGIDKK